MQGWLYRTDADGAASYESIGSGVAAPFVWPILFFAFLLIHIGPAQFEERPFFLGFAGQAQVEVAGD